MFACASYPTWPEYLQSVELEARQNVRRIRHHPSVVIWTGNNEDYQLIERYNLKYEPDDTNPESWLKSEFPARYIYERFLPEIVERLSDIQYHRSSPYSGYGKPTTDKSYGDLHQCQSSVSS